MSDALFERSGDIFVPQALTRGPWTPHAQHGGPPSALLASTVERYENGDEMFVARVTIELLRPVPLTPLRIATRWARPGRKVQLVEAVLYAGETEVARALGLRIRRTALVIPAGARPQAPGAGAAFDDKPPPPPSQGTPSLPQWAQTAGDTAYHSHAVEHRFVEGGFDRPGPATDWIRLRVPLVAGEPTSPLARVAGAADFGNGISWVLSRLEGYSFINPDLTIYLHRHPAGEWVCLQARTLAEEHGVALAESRLWDERGPIGRSLQSLILERTE